MGTRMGNRSRGGTRGGGAGAATATLETHSTRNTGTLVVGVAEQWPQAKFPTVPASRLHLGISLLLLVEDVDDPGLFSLFSSRILTLNGVDRGGGGKEE